MVDELKSAMGAGAADTLDTMVEEVNAALPYLTQVGYRPRQVEVEVGPLPRMVIRLSKRGETDPQVLAAILAEQADRQLLCTLLAALQQAEALQGQVQVCDCPIREVEVELGSPPTVRLVFLESAQEALPPGPVLPPTVSVTGSGIVPVVPLAPAPEAIAPPTVVSAGPAEEAETSIRFRCPGCRVRYKVRPERAGEALECHRCGTPLTIPARSTEAPPGYRG
jgi:hypothetical protein